MTSDILQHKNLEYIDTTSQANGYPCRLKKAVIGFESFEQAQEFADEYNLNLEVFKKRDGWAFWYRTRNKAFEPFVRTCEDYGDDYRFFESSDQFEFFENEVRDILVNCTDFEEAKQVIENAEKVYDEICNLSDDEFVVTRCGSYYDTIKKKTMQYEYDTHHYAIGVILN